MNRKKTRLLRRVLLVPVLQRQIMKSLARLARPVLVPREGLGAEAPLRWQVARSTERKRAWGTGARCDHECGSTSGVDICYYNVQTTGRPFSKRSILTQNCIRSNGFCTVLAPKPIRRVFKIYTFACMRVLLYVKSFGRFGAVRWTN